MTAENLSALDTLPPDVTYVYGSMRSGTTCAGAADVEDENATDIDETNPFGMQSDGFVVRGSASSLAPNGTFAMVFDVILEPAPQP